VKKLNFYYIFFTLAPFQQLELNEMIYGALRLYEIYEQYFITLFFPFSSLQVHFKLIFEIKFKNCEIIA
jgi:hypothetical protein